MFVTNAEQLTRRLGQAWPAALEAAAADHLRQMLGIDDPYPRSPEVLAI